MQPDDSGLLIVGRGQWFDDFVRLHLQSPVGQWGFSRRGRTWNRRLGEVIHVLHIQAGRFGPGISASMGVFVPRIHQFIRAEPPPKFIAQHLCQLQSALGHWGSGLRFEPVDPGDPTGKRVHIGQPTVNPDEVVAALLAGAAVLDEVRSVEDVRILLLDLAEQQRWSSGGPSGNRDECLAVLAALSGNAAGARELLLSALDNTPPEARTSRGGHYRELASRLGISLP